MAVPKQSKSKLKKKHSKYQKLSKTQNIAFKCNICNLVNYNYISCRRCSKFIKAI